MAKGSEHETETADCIGAKRLSGDPRGEPLMIGLAVYGLLLPLLFC